jgi:phosphoribosylformylglycinamidine synthase
MMKATVKVMPKASVLDPQGEAVRRAIQSLGLADVENVRVGKCIELEISGEDYDATLAALEKICEDLLSNPVVEDFGLHLSGGESAAEKAEKKARKAEKEAEKEAKKAKKKDKEAKKADKKTAKVEKPAKEEKVVKTEKVVAKPVARPAAKPEKIKAEKPKAKGKK